MRGDLAPCGSDVDITAEWEAMGGPSIGSARGGSVITVRGAGLTPTGFYLCEFSMEDGHAQRSAPVVPERRWSERLLNR